SKQKLQSDQTFVQTRPIGAGGLNTIKKMSLGEHAHIRAHQKADCRNDLDNVSAAVRKVRLLESQSRHDPRQHPIISLRHNSAAVNRARRSAPQLVLPKNDGAKNVQVLNPRIDLETGTPKVIFSNARNCGLTLTGIRKSAECDRCLLVAFRRIRDRKSVV